MTSIVMRSRHARSATLPVVTLAVGLVTAAVSIVALAHPDLLRLLERHPTPDRPWVWWRLVTSLLVHEGWAPLALNLVGFAIVGSAVERRAGAVRWGVLYLLGGLVGELVGIRWQPVGAGNSVATFGLIGGLLALSLRPRRASGGAWSAFAEFYAPAWVIVYAGLALGGTRGAVLVGVLCAPLGALVARARAGARPDASATASWGFDPLGVALACGTLLAALLLCARHDIHGPPLIVGAIGGAMLCRGPAAAPPAR